MRPARKRARPVSLAGVRPGYEGKMELTTRQVDNPYAKGETEIVPFNARESNARTLNLGKAQERAYNHVWGLWHQAGHHAYGSTTREPVDGGGTSDPLPLRALEAIDELNVLRKALGKDDWRFIEITCMEGLGYKDVARILFAKPKQIQIREATWYVKTAYNRLTVELNYATPDHITRLHNYK